MDSEEGSGVVSVMGPWEYTCGLVILTLYFCNRKTLGQDSANSRPNTSGLGLFNTQRPHMDGIKI